MNIGTWNVRTMTTDGKVEMVQAELGKFNISCLGLSELGSALDRERSFYDKRGKPDNILG